jgi:hypothetical protein
MLYNFRNLKYIRSSFFRVFHDRYITSSKANSPNNFHCHIVSLNLSSSCLQILPRLSITFILTSILPLVMCFRRQFLCKMLPIHLAFLLQLLVGHLSPPWLFVTHLHFSLTIGPSFSSTTFKNLAGISDVSTFQHHTKFFSQFISVLVFCP